MLFDGAEDPAAESGAVSAKMSDVGDADGCVELSSGFIERKGFSADSQNTEGKPLLVHANFGARQSLEDFTARQTEQQRSLLIFVLVLDVVLVLDDGDNEARKEIPG
ncbi:Hypothetical Protein FCC1311_024992 [Hondaea fermentalgiana]|uniref:Uncharacterized protein n=1 Tax=Hondaea fermentalgiana TaxID=2315210 RepID=A0A2R5G928_9STRA|nr:Hypothetical Protein FCC1311_024992 [Hondaea fermentalgiana]|eukprot:GBG26278.1 Hypothetical Protein FCC1311_024992 [Hondaea fermentalgiana]